MKPQADFDPKIASKKLMREAEAAARDLEDRVSAPLSPEERTTLMRLLRKIYKPEPSAPALKAEK